MSSFFGKLKAKASGKCKSSSGPSNESAAGNSEPTFSIQPHPAKSNDPADLRHVQQGGLATSNQMAAHHARDPHVPTQEIQNNLEQPLSREEVRMRAEELNK
ncbi:hypothetical protein L208DRAFT_1393968 [Tricholoma matsutake]|nr:hypothetical protein L208DRAFT_1393968 [Tricholoma matsutake 945]